ncbi:MAG: hypothetical protein KJ709_01595 [Nanoarchaeota archaeon]|nr:hypothetical protein [Nanoarchaeota archaeon]
MDIILPRSEYVYRVKRFFRFTNKELYDLAISIFVVTLVFAFDDGRQEFSIFPWLGNFISVLILVAIAYVAHVSIQKLVGFIPGYRSEYKVWGWGIVFALLLTFVTQGKWVFVATGGVFVYAMTAQRIGHFRYGLSGSYSIIIASSGAIINIAMALFFKLFFLVSGSPLMWMAMKINLWLAIYSMLPIPPLDGGTAFFGGRLPWSFFFGFVLAGVFMIWLFNNVFTIIFGTLLLAIILWLIFYLVVERFAY